MRFSIGRKVAMLLAGLALTCLVTDAASTASRFVLPNPVLYVVGQEPYETGGKSWTRYKFAVDNSAAYPDTLFEASPNLPPCGLNTKSSKTWVDIYDQRGKRLYGFCALGKSADLNQLWFALERDVVPPSWVYIEMTDRSTNTKYKSNLAETTP
ncbi:MAG: hypothetical protein QOC99_3890 [Acidobacteriota bacterium]|jgi:hypothetical protein|nr:hypothetical protein [Acidobacteriota bacterium]MDT7781378.1 hypothetical protein [Acidobacteriota bacterium]